MKNDISIASRLFNVFNVIFMVFFGIICIYPFYYLMIYALSDPQLSAGGIGLLPKGFTFKNFETLFTMKEIPQAAFISVARTICASTITVLCSSFFAYLMTKQEMYCRKFIYRFVILTMYVSGGLIPTYLVYRAYDLRNSFWVYIIPGALSAYYIILLKTSIEQLPASLEESAELEGAGIFTCFAKIVFPLSKPIIATIAVFAIVAEWNYWFDTHIYISDNNLYTLQYVLYRYLQDAQMMAERIARGTITAGASTITPTAVRMTVTAVITLPVMCVYPFMQRYFVKGILIGAVKG
ncbi:MAG: carbohydrate ABC transporter permease [Christensenella sp.]